MAATAVRPGDIVVYDSISRSNMPVDEKKSAIRQWVEGMLGPIQEVRAKDAPGGVLTVARQTSESAMTAGALAFLHVNAPTGLDVGGVPLDGAGGAIVAGASALMGHSELASDARNIGTAGVTVWSFRKMTEFFTKQKIAKGHALPSHLIPGSRVSGDISNDPVVQAAASL